MSKTTVKSVTIKKDRVDKVFAALYGLLNKQVLVGIPDSKAHRDGEANNATIGYAMEFGMPANNVPARPFLIPGVEAARSPALEELKKAGTAALDGDARKAEAHMERAGMLAADAVKRTINSNIPPPLKPSTIRGRKYQRGTKSRRDSENRYLDMVKGGMSPKAAQAETGIVALINTGQLRNSITSVVRDKRPKSRPPKAKDLGIPNASDVKSMADKAT